MARIGIIGSSVPCCTITGMSCTASQSTCSESHPGANGLIASTPAGRTASPPRSATASAIPAPCEKPPKIASARARPSSAHCSSTKRVDEIDRVGEAAGVDALGRDREPRVARRAGRVVGARGITATKPTLGIEVRQEPAEVLLVGAVAVQQDEQTVGVGAPDHVREQCHRAFPWTGSGEARS